MTSLCIYIGFLFIHIFTKTDLIWSAHLGFELSSEQLILKVPQEWNHNKANSVRIHDIEMQPKFSPFPWYGKSEMSSCKTTKHN